MSGERSRTRLSPSAAPRPLRFEKALLRKLFDWLGASRVALRLWDGSLLLPRSRTPTATVEIRSRKALYRILADPELQIGCCYADGELHIDNNDLVAVLIAANKEPSPRRSALATVAHKTLRHQRGSGMRHAKRNIHAHYDLGSEFYRLWLDSTMTYTCAYFSKKGMSLHSAQVAKMDLICRKLGIRRGDRVVEAGSGWGGLALHMAEQYGATVRTYNLSREQTHFLRARTRERGLERRVEVIEDDYRAASGSYDVFVSVGMLEHVGRRHYAELGRVINRCLAPGGRGLIHSIGRHRYFPTNRWIQQNIFPGGYVPSLREMMTVFETGDLVVRDVENLRAHYAITLGCWLDAFEAESARIEDMFDASFVRAWRLYLAASLASFHTGWQQLYQIVFTRRGDCPELPERRLQV